MFHGLSHIDVPVTDLAAARRLYEGVLGFAARRSGEGWVDLDGGASHIRLILTPRPESRVALRVQTSDVEAAFARLVESGLKPVYEPMRTPDLELVGSVMDADGHTISVWRELSEDEYGFVPELPTQAKWAPEAETLLKSLLASVPALFRGLARRKVVKNAEHLAGASGAVTQDHVVRAYIISNAKVTRFRVIEPLKKHGFDPANYPEEFDS